MPIVQAKRTVSATREQAFDLSQSVELRFDWDPFVRKQYLLDATRPGKGVHTYTRSRIGPKMESVYLTFKRPERVGMKMTEGPWFFRTFSGAWRFVEVTPGTTEVTFRYNFTTKPAWAAPAMEWIGLRLLTREIEARVSAFARAIDETDILDRLAALPPDEPPEVVAE